MKIKKDPLLGTWGLAESDDAYKIPETSANLVPLDFSRILIADDEKPVRMAIARVLAGEFTRNIIEEAEDGFETVILFAKHHHAVITMDLAMPGMDGYAAYGTIRDICRANKWQMPAVIFCTGYDPPNTITSLVTDDPACCIVRKPVSNRILIEAVRKRLPPPAP